MIQKRFIIKTFWSALFTIIVLFLYLPFTFGVETVSSGKTLPNFTLDTSEDKDDRQYLGLKNSNSFSISQISAKLILIEIFSLYCPICHKQAPITNKIYKFIQQDPDLRQDIKIIGIGAGNNLRETGVFKTRYKVHFPLFSDPDFKIHKKLGEPRTPFIFLATNKGKVLFTHYGVINDVDEFMSKLRKFYKQQ